MKKKCKATKIKSAILKFKDFIPKQALAAAPKRNMEAQRRFKSPDTKDLETTKESRFTRRFKSPLPKSPQRQSSKGPLPKGLPFRSLLDSLKSTPNKSLAIIENNVSVLKEKPRNKLSTKMASESKLVSSTGHRKTKSQEIISHKALNYDMFVPRKSVPKSVIKVQAHRTRAGLLDGKEKINQDRLICEPYYLTHESSLFGVCDGHGVNGHFVSDIVKRQLPLNLEFFLVKNKLLGNKDINPELLEYSLKMAFKKTACDLLVSQVDIDFSGSTTVLTLVLQKTIWCANIGDSRAVLYSEIAKDHFVSSPLSHDHKGQDPVEAKRIDGMGGKLESYLDEEGDPVGPLRVWIPDKNIPGLAMTRSFGDYYASTVGVTSDPEIISRKLRKEDKVMIIASDGLWEFIDPQSAMEIVKEYYVDRDCEGAAKALEKAAVKAWQDEDEIIDDITVVVVFFDTHGM